MSEVSDDFAHQGPVHAVLLDFCSLPVHPLLTGYLGHQLRLCRYYVPYPLVLNLIQADFLVFGLVWLDVGRLDVAPGVLCHVVVTVYAGDKLTRIPGLPLVSDLLGATSLRLLHLTGGSNVIIHSGVAEVALLLLLHQEAQAGDLVAVGHRGAGVDHVLTDS